MDIFLIVVVVAVLVIALAGLLALSDRPSERAGHRARDAEQDVIRISRETQDEIVLTLGKRDGGRGVAGLLGAVDEDVCSRRLAGDEKSLGDGLEMEFLIEHLAGV